MNREEILKEIREDYYNSLKVSEYEEVKETEEKVKEYINDRDKEWIPKYKFLKDLRKNGTESNEIYKKWKKENGRR